MSKPNKPNDIVKTLNTNINKNLNKSPGGLVRNSSYAGSDKESTNLTPKSSTKTQTTPKMTRKDSKSNINPTSPMPDIPLARKDSKTPVGFDLSDAMSGMQLNLKRPSSKDNTPSITPRADGKLSVKPKHVLDELADTIELLTKSQEQLTQDNFVKVDEEQAQKLFQEIDKSRTAKISEKEVTDQINLMMSKLPGHLKTKTKTKIVVLSRTFSDENNEFDLEAFQYICNFLAQQQQSQKHFMTNNHNYRLSLSDFKKKKELLYYVEGDTIDQKYRTLKIDSNETDIGLFDFLNQFELFIKDFVEKKLKGQTNKFKEEKLLSATKKDGDIDMIDNEFAVENAKNKQIAALTEQVKSMMEDQTHLDYFKSRCKELEEELETNQRDEDSGVVEELRERIKNLENENSTLQSSEESLKAKINELQNLNKQNAASQSDKEKLLQQKVENYESKIKEQELSLETLFKEKLTLKENDAKLNTKIKENEKEQQKSIQEMQAKHSSEKKSTVEKQEAILNEKEEKSKQLRTKDDQLALLQKEVESKDDTIKKLKDEMNINEHKLNQTSQSEKQEQQKNKEVVEFMQKQIDNALRAKEEKEKEFKDARNDLLMDKDNLKRENEFLTKRVEELNTRINSMQQDIQKGGDKEAIQKQLYDLQDQLDEAKRQAHEAQGTAGAKDAELARYKSKMADMQEELDLAKANEAEQQKECDSRRNISESLKQRIEKAISREAQLLRKVEELQSSQAASSEREMALSKQVRELKLETEKQVSREGEHSREMDENTERQNIIREQLRCAIQERLELKTILEEKDSRLQAAEGYMNKNTPNVNGQEHTQTTMRSESLQKEVDLYRSEISKLKSELKEPKVIYVYTEVEKNPEDSVDRATNLLSSFSAGNLQNWYF